MLLSRKTTITLTVLVVGIALIVAVAALKPQPEAEPKLPPPLPKVTVIDASPSTLSLTITAQGSVAPKTEIDLVSQVSGRVVAVADNYADGGFFQAGQKLIQIDNRDYGFALTRANSQVAKAAEQLALERGRARQAKREWRDLGDDNANALFLRQPQITSAEAALAAAEADRDKSKLDLVRTAISAPFPGRIRNTMVDLGQFVTPGTRIAKVYSTDVVEIRLPLSDRQAVLIDLPMGFENDASGPRPGVTLTVSMGDQRYHWQGQIVRTDASIDLQSRMIVAVAEVRNPFLSTMDSDRPPLSIGMFVEAKITGRQLDNVLEIPKTALYRGRYILALDSENRIHYQPIQVLHSKSDTVVVGQIAPGTRLVANRLSQPVEGMRVAPQTPANNALQQSEGNTP